jgi:hypothetical protein
LLVLRQKSFKLTPAGPRARFALNSEEWASGWFLKKTVKRAKRDGVWHAPVPARENGNP